MMAGSFPCWRRSSATLRTPTLEKVIRASPGWMRWGSTVRDMQIRGVFRWLQADFDLLEVLTQWNQMPTVEPYQKLDITRYITLITKIREQGFLLSKEQELRCANVTGLFLRVIQSGPSRRDGPLLRICEARPRPSLGGELEQYCRKLDLYFSFAKAFDCPVDEDKLYDNRERAAEEINEILLHRLRNNIRFCDCCGRALPLYHHGRLCDGCYRRRFSRRTFTSSRCCSPSFVPTSFFW